MFDAVSSHSSLGTEPALEEPEEVVEKPLESPVEPPEEPPEVVERRPEPPIEKLVAPFVEPQLVPRVLTPQRKGEPNRDPPVVYPRPRLNQRSERPRSQPSPKERKSDDISRNEDTNEDLGVVFPHLNENHKPPPSRLPQRKGCRYFMRKIFSFGRTKIPK